MNIVVKPSVAKGTVAAPPSKSMAHRLLISAALSEGTSVISNIAYSQDILATIDCIKALGGAVSTKEDTVTVNGIGTNFPENNLEFPCRESGSTIRFFMAIAMITGKKSVFLGSDTLLSRPFSIYEDICAEQGIKFLREKDKITVEGRLAPGRYELPGNISSQFITGLLFVLPLLDADSDIVFNTEVESRSYINLTLQAMDMFGVKASWSDETSLHILGKQTYKANNPVVEGDYSNAAFLDIYNYMGGEVKTTGLMENSLQGDKVYLELFKKLSAGNTTIDISDCPDLGPILFVAAAINHGAVFTGTKRLKIKESDRGSVMYQELRKFGIRARLEENEIEIYKGEIVPPSVPLLGHNDHRVVMSLTTLLSVTGGKLLGAKAVQKSFPDYFEKIKDLGIQVETEE